MLASNLRCPLNSSGVQSGWACERHRVRVRFSCGRRTDQLGHDDALRVVQVGGWSAYGRFATGKSMAVSILVAADERSGDNFERRKPVNIGDCRTGGGRIERTVPSRPDRSARDGLLSLFTTLGACCRGRSGDRAAGAAPAVAAVGARALRGAAAARCGGAGSSRGSCAGSGCRR